MKIKNGVLLEIKKSDIVNGEFIIPNSVSEIGFGAFYNCNRLKSIIIPNSVTKIGANAFYFCTNLKSITIPNSVTKIGYSTFGNCYNLTSITIPDSVIKIGYNAFYNCDNLEEININKDNQYYSSEDGVLFNKDKTILIKYPKGKKDNKYIIPNSVALIREHSFYFCTNLESIAIPNFVTEINDHTFANCSKLASIIIPNSITSIGYSAFLNCNNLKSKKGNYKAFKKGLMCNNMQYIPNEWNIIKGDIKICKWGLHYVTNLFDIFNYYSGDLEKDIEIWEVEVGDIVVNHKDDSKRATNAIKPIKKLSREEIISILNNK